MFRYLSREEWGAEPPKARVHIDKDNIEGIFVHYTGMYTSSQEDHSLCKSRVKGIQEFHQGPSRGWSDIAYSWLVCKHGFIYEGRGWEVQGAHTQGYNSTNHAVCFLGGDRIGRDDVTHIGREALSKVIRESFRRGYGKLVRPHRAVNSTSCPGDELASWVTLKGWRLPDPKPYKGFWKWLHWYEGKRDPEKRPNVPKPIPDSWWEKRKEWLNTNENSRY